jgi:hypothetical protein
MNGILRVAWILSICPDIVEDLSRPEFLTGLVGALEIFRRCIWNFFRLEKEHLANCGHFKVINEYQLPFNEFEMNFDRVRSTFSFDNSRIFSQESCSLCCKRTWKIPKLK